MRIIVGPEKEKEPLECCWYNERENPLRLSGGSSNDAHVSGVGWNAGEFAGGNGQGGRRRGSGARQERAFGQKLRSPDDEAPVPAPVEEVYGASEAPNGELGYYVVGDGTTKPYRARTRPPSFIHFAIFPYLIEGHLISDVVAVLGSLNIIAAELDR